MENRKFLRIITLLIMTSVFLFISSTYTEGFVLPGFQGYILDKETGKPIENAYVICFTDYYSFGQRFNLGGPNSRPDSMQIAKTDKNGFFIMKPYKQYSGGWTDGRTVYIFKEDYVYARQYLQLSEKKNVLRRNIEIFRPTEEIPLKNTITIYLSNKEQRDINGEVTINAYLGLLYSTRYYCAYFRDENKSEFKRLKPYFSELYKIFSEHSEDIIKTFPEPHLVENWKHDLKWFWESLKEDMR